MADIKTQQERSRNMSAIKAKDTRPELIVRHLLFSNGNRYRLHVKYIPGHPDLWLRKYNTAIFVNGCFWHRHKGCKCAYTPKSRVDFWNRKFDQNIQRDKIVRQELAAAGIRCLIVWECTVTATQKRDGNENALTQKIVNFLNSNEAYMEL